MDFTTYSHDPLDRITRIHGPCAGTGNRQFSYGSDLSVTMTDEEGKKRSTLQDAARCRAT